jgi:hypothetical protein
MFNKPTKPDVGACYGSKYRAGHDESVLLKLSTCWLIMRKDVKDMTEMPVQI